MSTSPQTIAKNMSCLRPLNADGLKDLGEKGRANPDSVVTLKAKTVCEGQFRMQTYVRDLAPMLIDEPPHLLGENNARHHRSLQCLVTGSQHPAQQRGA
ncbi:MAG: hypothetical protein P8163_10240 [Candidatus Thiodiazotropha sp.]